MKGLLLFLLVAAAQTPAATPPRDSTAPKFGTGSISGQVTDRESREPISRALVTLVASSGKRQTAVADPKGRFAFSALPPGQYGVLAGPGDLRATHLQQAYGRDDPFEPGSTPASSGLHLKAGERRGDVNLSLVRALAMEGRLSDAEGQPVSDVSVSAWRPNGAPYPAQTALSDDRGGYRLYLLAAGRYRICALPTDSVDNPQGSWRLARTCYPAAMLPTGATDVVLSTADASGVDIELRHPGTPTISGSVVDANSVAVDPARAVLGGRVTEKQSGAPVAGAVVRISPMDSMDLSVPAIITGSDGTYEFTGLRPGNYVGSVSPDRNRPTHIRRDLFEETQGRTTLKPGEIREGVNVVLDRSLTIPVRVVDEAGQPLAGVQASATLVGRRSANPYSRLRGRSTNDQGRQRIFPLPPGRYIVCAQPEGGVDLGSERIDAERFSRTCYPSAASEADAQPIRLTEGDSSEIELRMRRGRTFTVSGSVVDARGDVPQNAMLTFRTFRIDGSSGTTTMLDSDGRFTIRNIVPGDYAVEVTTAAPMQPGQRQPLEIGYELITIGTADVEGLVIAMTRGVDVAGRFVLEDTDSPFPKFQDSGLSLTARLVNDVSRGVGSSNFAHPRDDRRFEFQGIFGKRRFSVVNVPTGWYTKAILYAGKDVIDEGAELKAGTDTEMFEVILSHRGPRIVGRVADSLGNAVPRARVFVLPATPARWAPFYYPVSATTTGAYRAGPMRPGDYVVIALDPKSQHIGPTDLEQLRELMKSGERISISGNEERTLDLTAVVLER